MKKNKKIVILLICLIVILCSVILLIILNGKQEISEIIKLGITNIQEINDKDIDVYNNFYLKEIDDYLVMYDYDSNILLESDYDFYSVEKDNYLVIYLNDDALIYDNLGTLLLTGTGNNLIFNEYYIINDYDIYDYDFNLVYTIKSTNDYYDFYVNGEFLLDNQNGLVVNLKDRNIIINNIDYSYFQNEENILIYDEDYVYIYDIINDKLSEKYNVIKNSYYSILSNDKEEVYLTFDSIYYSTDDYKINDNYKLDINNCEDGFNILTLDGETTVDKCVQNIEVYDNILIATSYTDYMDTYYLYIDNKYIASYDCVYVVGNYIILEDYEKEIFEIYDLSGNKMEWQQGIYQINDYYYISYYGDYTYILDDNLVILYSSNSTIDYNSDGLIIVNNDDGTNLYYYDELIYKWNGFIELKDTYIVLDLLFSDSTYVLYIGSDNLLSSNDLNFANDVYKDIDIDSIIEEYSLDGDIYYENSELFQKYAYIVINNDNLGEYTKEVLDMYKVLLNNEEYLNELYFFDSLKDLKIVFTDYIDGTATGTYSTNLVTLTEDSPQVIYHELMHFIYFQINYSNSVCNCSNSYYLCSEVVNDNCSYEYIRSYFIDEAGAELYTAKYFTKKIDAYTNIVPFLEVIEYIYGENYLQELYFSSNSTYLLTNLIISLGYDVDDYERIMTSLDNITNIYHDYNDADLVNILDLGITMYINNIGDDWMQDKEFIYILNTFEYFDYSSSEYFEDLSNVLNNNYTYYYEFADLIFASIPEYDWYKLPCYYLKIDGVSYISAYSYDVETYEYGILLIEYDFTNDEVVDYTFIVE